jgi:hypothetical protein
LNAPPRRLARRSALIGLAALLLVRIVLALCHSRHARGFPFYLSSAETLRVILSDRWAREPRWNVDVMWLPGAFWVYGSALRLWMRPLVVVPLLNTLFTLGTIGCLFFLTELLTGSPAIGLGAAAYAAFQAESLIFGTGGSADPLLHLSVVAGILCWARYLKDGRFFWMLAACALIAAGALVRYEAWLAAIGLGVFWIREWPRQKGWTRRLAPLIVLALPMVGWLLYQAAHWEALQFLKTAVAAHDEDFERMSRMERFVLAFGEFGARPISWIVPLLPVGAWLAAILRGDGDRVRRHVLFLGLWIAAAYLLVGTFVEVQIDLHSWFLTILSAPFVAIFVSRALGRLNRSRRGIVLAVFAGLFLRSAYSTWSGLASWRPPKASTLRMDAAIKECVPEEPEAKILIEAFPAAPGTVPEHVLQQALPLDLGFDRVLFDRACDIAVPDPCSRQKPLPPSVFALGARELSPWLAERKVLLIVANADDPPAATGYEPVRFGDYEALVARGRPSLKRCLADRSF